MSAFATSGFMESSILIVDGRGSPYEDLLADESAAVKKRVRDGWETISLYAASGASVTALEKHLVEDGDWLRNNGQGMPRFGSLGGMFSAVAQQIFGDPMEAGKVMGLAPYGTAEIPSEYFFEVTRGGFVFHDEVLKRFRHDERWPLREDEYKNLASSVQSALEDALFYLLRRLRRLNPSENLCYSGGVALNSVANERIIRESGFKNIYITPAAEDSGPAIGAAYYGLWNLTGENTRQQLIHDALGQPYAPPAVSAAVESVQGIKFLKSDDVVSDAVDLLCDGKIIGWFDGGSEFGPRALGQRSIVCDPRRPDGKDVLNLRVKGREAFRPFAPAILLEEVANWFELDGTSPESPFMLRVCKFKPDKIDRVPSVVHVDYTGRLQTVTQKANGRFYDLIRKFYQKTGVPILLNTSFNVMGEPIVETPVDALASLLKSNLDCSVFEDRIAFRQVK
jgi:carbamoyltransferase